MGDTLPLSKNIQYILIKKEFDLKCYYCKRKAVIKCSICGNYVCSKHRWGSECGFVKKLKIKSNITNKPYTCKQPKHAKEK